MARVVPGPAQLTSTSDGDGRHPVRDGLEGDRLMDEIKRTYRNIKTDLKKSARGIDGTDFKDQVGNAGDEARKDLGNTGDDVRRAGRAPNDPRPDPDTTQERPM
jgi:hypothetical protein